MVQYTYYDNAPTIMYLSQLRPASRAYKDFMLLLLLCLDYCVCLSAERVHRVI